MLIEAGADVNLSNDNSALRESGSYTPLNSAIQLEFSEDCEKVEDKEATEGIVELLLQKGANVNYIDYELASPLRELLSCSHYGTDKENRLFRLLIDYGAKPLLLKRDEEFKKYHTMMDEYIKSKENE